MVLWECVSYFRSLSFYFFAGFIFINCLQYLYNRYKVYTKGPPGPLGIPFLGYYPFLGKDPHRSIQQVAAVYNDVFCVNLLGVDYYVLNSIKSIKEAFVKNGDLSSGRPIDRFNVFTEVLSAKSVALSEGVHWKKHRRLLLQAFSDQGLGKSEIEPKIHRVCELLVENITHSKHDCDLNLYLTNYASNVISSLLFSKFYNYDDPEYIRLRETVRAFFKTCPGIDGNLSGPLFRLWMYVAKHENYLMLGKIKQLGLNYFMQLVKERESIRSSSNDEDYMDMYLKQRENMSNPDDDGFDLETFALNSFTLFTAGTESTATTIIFGISHMVAYPHYQTQVQEEIDAVIGSRRVAMEDMNRLPYTNAVIHEIHRFACIAAFPSPHSATEPMTVCGYEIPKRAVILYNLGQITRDPECYKNPHNFDPENFLDNCGNFTKREASIPFGVGKRICLGFKLAETEIAIGFVTLMQKFKWFPQKDENEVGQKGFYGFVCMPKNYRFQAIPRQPSL